MPSSCWGIYRFQTLASSFLSGGGDGDHHGRKADLAGGGGLGEEAELGQTRPLPQEQGTQAEHTPSLQSLDQLEGSWCRISVLVP